MKYKIAILTLISFVAQVAGARENWPEPAGADLQRQREFEQHEAEVISNDMPQISEWEKRGKPFIPWAAKPGDLPQAKVPAFPGAEGGGKFSFGGRGGKIFVVTNLDDSGPRRLRGGRPAHHCLQCRRHHSFAEAGLHRGALPHD